MFIFPITDSTPIDVPDKPLKKEENLDDEEEEAVDQDKALEKEPKHQRVSARLLLKEFSKLQIIKRPHLPNLPLLLLLRRILRGQRKEIPRYIPLSCF